MTVPPLEVVRRGRKKRRKRRKKRRRLLQWKMKSLLREEVVGVLDWLARGSLPLCSLLPLLPWWSHPHCSMPAMTPQETPVPPSLLTAPKPQPHPMLRKTHSLTCPHCQHQLQHGHCLVQPKITEIPKYMYQPLYLYLPTPSLHPCSPTLSPSPSSAPAL